MDNIQSKPIIATFPQLAASLQSLHFWHKERVSELHDIWKKGAPTPNSIIRAPKHYDPRKVQPGNYEARIVFPNLLLKWVRERAKAQGAALTDQQIILLVEQVGQILST